MTSRMHTLLLAPMVLAGALAGHAQAAITHFDNAASFAAAAGQPATDSFDGLALDFIPAPLVRTVGSTSYSVRADGGLYGTGSAADTWLSTSLSGVTLTFDGFAGGVRAVGGNFFGTDITGLLQAGTAVTLTATDAGGATATHTLTDALPSSFAGFVSTTGMVSLTVEVDSMDAWATANNMVTAVPEPGTYGLMLAGLAGIIAWRRQRRAD